MDHDKPEQDDAEAQRILLLISEAAHTYVKDQRKALTAQRQDTTWDESDNSIVARAAPEQHAQSIRSGDAHDYSLAYRKRQHSAKSQEAGADSPFATDYSRIVHSPCFRRLQGKSQLIPAGENEFFRTRLTHSLEVAEIATRIARRLNRKYAHLPSLKIDLDIVASAGLLHDVGHPPFGHSGEEALNAKMRDFGGFEGNAQTLRIITRLENRLGQGNAVADAIANPRGLNLCFGTIASILKYDAVSRGAVQQGDSLVVSKGYYPEEKDVVDAVKSALGVDPRTRLYTIECQIMDIADDIAYSAYDLEDTLEAGIVAPFDFMSIDDRTLEKITADVALHVAKRNPVADVSTTIVLRSLADIFGTLLIFAQSDDPYKLERRADRLAFVGRTYAESLEHAENPLIRRQFLETVIERNIRSLSLDYNAEYPFLSTVHVDPSRLLVIEALKAFNFHRVITSRRLQLQHHRSKRIVSDIFDALAGDRGGNLLSEAQRQLLQRSRPTEQERMRFISDIVASLTDMEAIRLYDQLTSSRNAPFLGYSR